MIRRCVIVVALLARCSAAFAHAAPDGRVDVSVVITPAPDGVVAHYELERPVTQFEYDSKSRDGTWAVTTPGLSYEAGQIRSAAGRPFDTFDVAVAARNELSGPSYPCVMKIGPTGRIVYASYFVGRQDEFRTSIEFEASRGAVVLGLATQTARWNVDRAFFGRHAGTRYVFVGPKAYVRKGTRADYVVGPETPAWLQPEIARIATRVLPFYTQNIDVTLPRRPLFLITTQSSSSTHTSMAAQADVTDGPNVAVRFFGDRWAKRSELATRSLDHSIAHEVAHFWNSHFFYSQSDEGPWLHEGGAEYWALIAQRRLGLTGGKDPTSALNDCIDLLGPRGLGAAHAKVAYACGAALQWFADLGEQGRGRDIFALWRDMFARAEANGGFYSAAMFRSLAGRTSPAVEEAFRLIFEPADISRWEKLPPLLATLGAKIEPAPFPADKLRNRIVFHLLKQACGEGSHGKRNFDDHFVLDAGDHCGPLAGDPEVDAINGVNLFRDPTAAYDEVRAACESKATVTFSRTGKQDRRTMTCTVPFPPLPPTFKLAAGS